ncbi:hypothetical protein [Clostridium puniceum]|nr:hypothetical protein [Clostridium puniceum]
MVEDKEIFNVSSFINKNSKWEANKYLSKNNMYFVLRDRLG